MEDQGFCYELLLEVFVQQGLTIDQNICDVSNLDSLISVKLALVLKTDMNHIRILDENLVSLFDVLCQRFIRVVERHDAKIVLKINQQEAHWNVLLFW